MAGPVGERSCAAARIALLFGLLVMLAVTSCTATPPPPVESTETVTSTPKEAPAGKNAVVVAIDEIGVGFNPHLLADQSPANTAVSSLVLPSVFRPKPDSARPGGSLWERDDSVVLSAVVTSQSPFVVRYVIRDEAQWSDGAPIAAEDFRYLWQQMITAPGVVDPAGYELITDVLSSDSGKTVTVEFSDPYPAWRELFADLLPSHLVKDSPGGFAEGLSSTIPVSGAHFNVKSVDRGRDEILLERNDRFWGMPTTPDQILLRRGGTAAQLAHSLRTNDAQVAQIHGGVALEQQLASIPSVRTETVYQPRVLQFALNTTTGMYTNRVLRSGILGLVDPTLLAIVASGGGSKIAEAKAQILAPSDPGYEPTAPAAMTREQALQRLAKAGYRRVDGLITDGQEQLALVIGAPEGDDTAVAVANTIADQLRQAGIASSVLPSPSEQLYGQDVPSGRVDAVLSWVRAASDPATTLASRFGCPGTTRGVAEIEANRSPPPPNPSSVSPTTESPMTAAPPPAGARTVTASNIGGVCDPDLQTHIDAALRGKADIAQTLDELEPRLWDLAAVLPVLQDTTVVAAGLGVSGVSLEGAVPAGIFNDASAWTRTVK